ncbi:MAG: hypothetical protein C4534_06715 [Gaiellales bacterium]|nr:MAG: hypothetical protein C4534_06715 [Gaiellales bacterium]
MSRARITASISAVVLIAAALISLTIFVTIPAGNAVAVEPSQLKVGVFFPDPEFPDEQLPTIDDIHQFESTVGRQIDVFLWYESISESFYADTFRPYAEEGRIIQLSWEPHNFAKDPNNQPEYRLNTITAGNHDTQIRRWARELRDFGYTIYFRPMCEMNGDWVAWGGTANGNSPADYIPAWRHIHDIFRQEGADNVKFIWSPNRAGSYADANSIFDTYYPGDSYVDYVGINGYNWGTMYNTPTWTSSWQSFEEVFKYSYDVAVQRTGKPIVVSETASTEIGGNAQNGGKARWITDAFSIIPSRFPKMEMVTWFHINKETDWRINSSQQSLDAFRQAVSLPDSEPPVVSVDSPSPGATLSGTVAVEISASDGSGISKVELYVGDRLIDTKTSAPYGSHIYTRSLADGSYSVTAKAYDATGNTSTRSVEVTVDNSHEKNYFFGWYDNASPGMRTWLVIGNPTETGQDVEVYIGGSFMGSYHVAAHERVTPRYAGVAKGPVKVVSLAGRELLVSERVTMNGSFSELPATPQADLGTEHYLSWYDQVSQGMNTWLMVGNQGSRTAEVDVFIAGRNVGHYSVPAGGSVAPQYHGVMDGPVRVVSSNGQPLTVSERVTYNGTFNEVRSRTAAELGTEYHFTWYDQQSAGMKTWVVIGNQGTQTAQVGVYIGGQLAGFYNVPAGGRVTPNFPNLMNGPVRVVSSNGQPLMVSERSVFRGSFEEVPGVTPAELNCDQWFAWYDNASTGMKTWILVGNQSQEEAVVDIKIGNQLVGRYNVPAGGRVTPTFPGQMNGPVQVKSSVEGQPLVVSQRTTYYNSFDELPGASM